MCKKWYEKYLPCFFEDRFEWIVKKRIGYPHFGYSATCSCGENISFLHIIAVAP